MPAIHLTGDYNLTYVQIPKNAGTSIGHWIKEHAANSIISDWYNHPSPEHIHATHEKNFSFTVVRNPWDRTVSLYHFLKHFNPPHPEYKDTGDFKRWLYDLNGYGEFPSFDQWLNNASEFKLLPWIWWKVPTPQVTWANVDLFIKYENLETEFRSIQDIFKCYDPLPQQTVTRGIHWHHYHDFYTDDTRKLVASMYEEDIDRWQYTF